MFSNYRYNFLVSGVQQTWLSWQDFEDYVSLKGETGHVCAFSDDALWGVRDALWGVSLMPWGTLRCQMWCPWELKVAEPRCTSPRLGDVSAQRVVVAAVTLCPWCMGDPNTSQNPSPQGFWWWLWEYTKLIATAFLVTGALPSPLRTFQCLVHLVFNGFHASEHPRDRPEQPSASAWRKHFLGPFPGFSLCPRSSHKEVP